MLVHYGGGASTVLLVAAVPTRVRYSVGSMASSLGTAVFGGPTPLLAVTLIALLHTPLATALPADGRGGD